MADENEKSLTEVVEEQVLKTCPDCEGTGKVECDECGGTGEGDQC